MEKYKICASKKFFTDIDQLCDQCPLKKIISEGIKTQIESEIILKKELLSDRHFSKYIDNEIENASKAIQKTLLNETNKKLIDSKDRFLTTRIKNVIWNKERIKELNKYLKKGKQEINEYPRIFKEQIHFDLFKLFTSDIDESHLLAGYSFIYRAMIRDRYIYDDFKNKSYILWLDETYKIQIDRVKTYNDCKTPLKIRHYSSLKDNLSLN